MCYNENMTTTTFPFPSAAATAIETAWRAAFQEWETGQSHSPSADDLVHYAQEIVPAIDLDSDRLFDTMCEGHDLDILSRMAVAGQLA